MRRSTPKMGPFMRALAIHGHAWKGLLRVRCTRITITNYIILTGHFLLILLFLLLD